MNKCAICSPAGQLQRGELIAGLERLGAKLSHADAETIFKFFDTSGDGAVCINEVNTECEYCC